VNLALPPRERNLVFDLKDFDETLPAPWEWDLKRLPSGSRWLGAIKTCRMRIPGKHSPRVRARISGTPCGSIPGRILWEVWYTRLDMHTLMRWRR